VKEAAKKTLVRLGIALVFGIGGLLAGVTAMPDTASAAWCEFDTCSGGDCRWDAVPYNCDETVLGCKQTACGEPQPQ
jgi:hypothetical protein